jgi:hypothetical protein
MSRFTERMCKTWDDLYTEDETIPSVEYGQPGKLETYGEDWRTVQELAQTKRDHVWTVCDCDGELYIAAGIHVVNRLFYVVTKEPCHTPYENYPY